MGFSPKTNKNYALTAALILGGLVGCSGGNQANKVDEEPSDFLLAINVGGLSYTATDGTIFNPDIFDVDVSKGQTSNIKGSQDPTIYQTYREGDMQLTQALPNGEYDLIFHFAEPNETAIGARLFNVYAQGNKVISDLDIRGARDGKAFSALDRAVSNVSVTNGQLDIELKGIKGEPVLSGLIIQNRLPKKEQWQLVWQDEFNYLGAPDPNKWTHDIWPAKAVNSEDQVYTKRLKNVSVNGEHLIIKAFKEDYNNGHYTSGRIHTQGKGDFLYGRIDVRAKLPAGQGSWPAIWMLPSDPYKYATNCGEGDKWQGSSTCDAWPNSGEIDIMEHVGFDMQTVHGTVHNKAYYWVNWEQRKGSVEGVDVEQNFHVYSLEWTPEKITILMDDNPYFTYINEHTGWKAWPFDSPFHLILNLAIGGMWGSAGGPIDDSIFPIQMEVDYVRFYKPVEHK